MALFDADYAAAPAFVVHAATAGDPAALVAALTAEITAAIDAGETLIVDFKVTACGSGPQWLAEFITAATVSDLVVTAPIGAVGFVAVESGNRGEALSKLNAALAAAGPSQVYKIEVAGGGDGRAYLASALYHVGGG